MCVYAPLPSSHKDEPQAQNPKPCDTKEFADTMTFPHRKRSTNFAPESERCITLGHKSASLAATPRKTGGSLYRRCPETTAVSHKSFKRGKPIFHRRRLSAILEEPDVLTSEPIQASNNNDDPKKKKEMNNPYQQQD
ncbi:hypothetical protein CCMA1212_010130 [Trichoderma ghanense]|uniref:Uncharacterized protein n=1 Tax=Trichoderma ghanense TaxID=65468 RepID=A0ABY2GSE0_9HYPO